MKVSLSEAEIQLQALDISRRNREMTSVSK